jgi:hypothetical protein
MIPPVTAAILVMLDLENRKGHGLKSSKKTNKKNNRR